MQRHGFALRVGILAATVTVFSSAAWGAPLRVTGLLPGRHALAARSTTIAIDFDKAVVPASVNATTFRVFGRNSGPVTGTYAFANGNTRVIFTPSRPFLGGEAVRVNLSRTIAATDLTTLRNAGHFHQFQIRANPSGSFTEVVTFSNRVAGAQTRIYGAAACDWNQDGHVDLATVNEVSADIRVCLSRANGTALYHPFLPATPIGVEASPNDPADFNGDGRADLCTDASASNSTWVLLGAGDGTFASTQEIAVGLEPHGIAAFDVDGDGDTDIVNAHYVSDELGLMLNNGAGVFAAPTFFDGGVTGEYGLAMADMNEDGIADLVVCGNDLGGTIRVLLGNGDGTFTAAGPAQPSGGRTWVVVVDDVNGDGHMDASTANTFDGNAAILLGDGAGHFGPPALLNVGAHVPSTDLGDLDGDGDPDLVISCFGGGFWRRYRNDGAGNFTFVEQINANANPSCAVLYDADNDGDVDMALTDEIADVVRIMRNDGLTGVDPSPGAAFAIRANVPNPVRDMTRIQLVLPSAATVALDVFDITGRRIAGLAPERRGAGDQELTFEARDESGRPLEPGVYAYRVRADGQTRTSRMVVAR